MNSVSSELRNLMISEALLSSAGWSCVFGVEIGQDSRTCRGIRSSILWLETQDGGRLPRPGRSMSPVDPLHPPIQEKAHPDHHIQGPQIQGPIDVLFPFLWHLLLLDVRAPMRIWLDGVIPRCKEKGTAGLEQLGSRVFCATIVTLKGPILHLKMSVHHTRRVSQFFCNHDLVSWQILCQRHCGSMALVPVLAAVSTGGVPSITPPVSTTGPPLQGYVRSAPRPVSAGRG